MQENRYLSRYKTRCYEERLTYSTADSEAASALTHIIKTSLVLDSGVIPPTIGIQKFNPAIDFHDGRIKVVQELMPLPEKTRKRISVQAFGYGGAVSLAKSCSTSL